MEPIDLSRLRVPVRRKRAVDRREPRYPADPSQALAESEPLGAHGRETAAPRISFPRSETFAAEQTQPLAQSVI